MLKTRLAILLSILILMSSGLAMAELAPGTDAPAFELTDTEGNEHTLQQYLDDGKTVVIEWFNPDCPFIKKHHATAHTMDESFAKVSEHDVIWLAINSSAPGREGAGLERNQKAHKDYKMSFPILMDPEGTVGRAYGAKTTPHMFVITSDGKVAYNGAIDDNSSPKKMGETNYVMAALHSVMSDEKIAEASTRPYGCSVKYSK
ncbi:MAG: peroxiredoxin [Candidatus Krumholzibacteriia bacterium]|jgi:peroxiredoxin